MDRLLSSSCRPQFIAAAQCMSTTGKGLKKDECMRLQNALYACTREQKLAGPPVFISRAAPTGDLKILEVRKLNLPCHRSTCLSRRPVGSHAHSQRRACLRRFVTLACACVICSSVEQNDWKMAKRLQSDINDEPSQSKALEKVFPSSNKGHDHH
jgi:hypothetical protein